MKAYETVDISNCKFNADHYQELGAEWHYIKCDDVYDLEQRMMCYAIARIKMGLREADYDWESNI